MATCVDNITESRKELSGYVCQSTIVPSDVRGQTVVSSQPFSIGDTLLGKICKSSSFSVCGLSLVFEYKIFIITTGSLKQKKIHTHSKYAT